MPFFYSPLLWFEFLCIPYSYVKTCRLEKMHNVRAASFSFIQGLTKDYSPEDSLSDNSKEVLQRSRPLLGSSLCVCVSVCVCEYMILGGGG